VRVRRDLVNLVVGAALGIGGLLIFGSPESPVASTAIVAGAAILAVLLTPVFELAWNYLWVPWRELREQVEAIDKRTLSPPQEDAETRRQRVDMVGARLRVFREIQSELREMQSQANEILKAGYYSGYQTLRKRDKWELYQKALAGASDLQGFWELLRDTYEELFDYGKYPIEAGALDDERRENLEGFVSVLSRALEAVDEQIAKYRTG
jgi:hypothetical protein